MKILQFGATGQLAREVLRRAPAAGATIDALSRSDVELSIPEQVRSACDSIPRYDLVMIAAAYTAVDRAETEPSVANLVNATAPAIIAAACERANKPVVYVSTDYVFDGSQSHAWRENDVPNPVNAYGRSKLAGENAVLANSPKAIVLRTSWVFSGYGTNFLKTMVRLGGERDSLSIVDDQRGCPTYAGDLASFILKQAARWEAGKKDDFGVFHFVGAGACTWFDFATAIFDLADLGQPPTLKRLSTADYPTPARRPENSELDTTKLERQFGMKPRPWIAALTECLADRPNWS